MPNFRIGGKFVADVPAIARKNVEFEVYYISPLGSFATGNRPSRQAAMTCKLSKYTRALPRQ